MVAATNPYPKYSDFQHITSTQLISKGTSLLQVLFPNTSPGGPQVAAFIITSSGGGHTLLLADAIAFVELRNSVDTLRDVCPVVFHCTPRGCSVDLLQAIQNHGRNIQWSPHIVAFQVDLDTRNSFYKFLYPSYVGQNPESELIRVITRQSSEVCIGPYRLKRIEDSWNPPATHPNWHGMAFEQSDRVIRAWLHEANPNALQSALDEAQQQIDRTQAIVNQKQQEIQRQTAAGRYVGENKIRLDREFEDINQTIREFQNRKNFLTAQTVNSAAQTTLQCAITMQIDQQDKIQRLEHYVCQAIVDVIDRALDNVSWEDLQIGMVTIENFIRQKMNKLEERLPLLVQKSAESEAGWGYSNSTEELTKQKGGTLTDWEHFCDEVMPKRQDWMQQNFQDFCLEKIGHAPTDLERPSLEKQWKAELSKKLKWVNENLKRADNDLKILEDNTFTAIDIALFDTHKQQMVQVLRRGNRMTYSLGRELEELYQERDLVRQALQNHHWVHLVKRITTEGNVYYGIARLPQNVSDRPDPNSDLNEVHIPVMNIPNLVSSLRTQNHKPPQHNSSSHTWKWVVSGSFLALGIGWIANRYLRQRPLN